MGICPTIRLGVSQERLSFNVVMFKGAIFASKSIIGIKRLFGLSELLSLKSDEGEKSSVSTNPLFGVGELFAGSKIIFSLTIFFCSFSFGFIAVEVLKFIGEVVLTALAITGLFKRKLLSRSGVGADVISGWLVFEIIGKDDEMLCTALLLALISFGFVSTLVVSLGLSKVASESFRKILLLEEVVVLLLVLDS